jgi:hypothetical protein
MLMHDKIWTFSRKPVPVDPSTKLRMNSANACPPSFETQLSLLLRMTGKDAFTPEQKTRDLAKVGETSPLGFFGAFIDANGMFCWTVDA